MKYIIIFLWERDMFSCFTKVWQR